MAHFENKLVATFLSCGEARLVGASGLLELILTKNFF